MFLHTPLYSHFLNQRMDPARSGGGSEVAAEAVAGLGRERAVPEGVVGDVAVDGVAAGREHACAPGPAAAGAGRAELEAPREPPPRRIVHQAQRHGAELRRGAHRHQVPPPRRPRGARSLRLRRVAIM
jgi:hypothetical protein